MNIASKEFKVPEKASVDKNSPRNLTEALEGNNSTNLSGDEAKAETKKKKKMRSSESSYDLNDNRKLQL